MKKFLRLRHGLIPYLYSMNHRAAYEDLPLVMPLYYLEPEREEAYEIRNEYYFGSELLVSPITEKMDQVARAAGVKTWIPEGLWADFFSGMVYQGGRMMELWRGIEEIPVLLKAGAIVPMKDMEIYDNGTENPGNMEIRIFPAAEGHFTLWEDTDGVFVDGAFEDAENNWAYTELELQGNGTVPTDGSREEKQPKICFKINAAQGNVAALPEMRSWKLVFVGVSDAPVKIEVGGMQIEVVSTYYKEKAMLSVQIPETAVNREICVFFPEGLTISDGDREQRCFKLLERAQMKYDAKVRAMELILEILKKPEKNAGDSFRELSLEETVMGEISEILMA